MFGDAQWAWKSIILPLAPEWSVTKALQETPSTEESGMSDTTMEEYSHQHAENSGPEEDMQTCWQVEVRNSER